MFQILISGTRNQLTETLKETIRNVILSEILRSDVTLIHGACTGVDLYAESVAKEMGLKVISMPALWNLYGKAAGPIRNSQMLDMRPDVLLAFPSETSKGTYDTIRKALAKGIRTIITLLQ